VLNLVRQVTGGRVRLQDLRRRLTGKQLSQGLERSPWDLAALPVAVTPCRLGAAFSAVRMWNVRWSRLHRCHGGWPCSLLWMVYPCWQKSDASSGPRLPTLPFGSAGLALLDLAPVSPKCLVWRWFFKPLEHAVDQVAETSPVAAARSGRIAGGIDPVDR